MNRAEAYRRQAASDLKMLELLLCQPTDATPDCRRLHYLQMVAEKAGKAVVLALGGELPKQGYSHRFVGSFLQAVKGSAIGEALGWRDFPRYKAWLDSVRPLFGLIEGLHPYGDHNRPNVKYPWEGRDARGRVVWHVPAQHCFDVNLRSRQCRDLIIFLHQMVDRLDELARLRR